MSLTSAKKGLLVARKLAPAFALSGGFETGNEGWAPTNVQRVRDTSQPSHQGVWFMSAAGSGFQAYLDRALPNEAIRGLAIAVGCYVATTTSTPVVFELQYRRDSGAWTTFAQVTTTQALAWSLLRGSIPRYWGVAGLQIRMTRTATNQAASFDSWSIQGVRA